MSDEQRGQGMLQVERWRYRIEGVVQGVGFRPFVYQLAQRLGLSGEVSNDSLGVTIEVEGPCKRLDRFRDELVSEKPPLAVITRVEDECLDPTGVEGFLIRESRVGEQFRAQIASDTFVCDACLSELFDPADRRYRYPFINCTDCGPRFTIVTGIPYDRPLTTMADFAMCGNCQTEYDDPGTRRFHAQPNACPVCGPQLTLRDARGRAVDGVDPLAATLEALQQGKIVAIKGLGGYHLAVDAVNNCAVRTLRQRKQRDEKPFALMVRDLATARRIARVSDLEGQLLEGPECPIVLLEKREEHGLVEEIAPANRYFGVMLPYTPLHHLLFDGHCEALVMTSANISDEPIAFEDDEARGRLAGIADLFLTHDRRIHTRTDDSIARVMVGQPLLIRRSRGFVPRMVALPRSQSTTLSVGAELKNTVCLTRAEQAYLSQHVGDLKNLEVYDSFKATIAHLSEILEVRPERVACDLHPDYDSTRYAREESGLPVIAVQHHHAHLASCLAEHGCSEHAIGVIFDGMGYGADGHIWGGEFLIGDVSGYERVGHFRYLPMPGGDLATREPWRMALSYLLATHGQLPETFAAQTGVVDAELRLVKQMVDKRINSPLTSSCGRLFDGVAAMLGLHSHVSFEGQAAMSLEMIADPGAEQPFDYLLADEDGQLVFDYRPMVKSLSESRVAGVSREILAGRFHATLASMVEDVCVELRHRSGLRTVVLSGGVFQNALLTRMVKTRLTCAGFSVLMHSLVPPNDGGLALGQAVIAGFADL